MLSEKFATANRFLQLMTTWLWVSYKKTADSGDVWKQTCILPFLCSIVSDIDAKVVWWQVYLVIACNTGKLALQ